MVETRQIKLPEVLDISFCEDLYQQFDCLLKDGAAIRIDAANVKKTLTPCVQVLLAAGLEAKRRAIPFECLECSPSFIEAFKCLGLSDYLVQWKVK